jgi:hypothetical protein
MQAEENTADGTAATRAAPTPRNTQAPKHATQLFAAACALCRNHHTRARERQKEHIHTTTAPWLRLHAEHAPPLAAAPGALPGCPSGSTHAHAQREPPPQKNTHT